MSGLSPPSPRPTVAEILVTLNEADRLPRALDQELATAGPHAYTRNPPCLGSLIGLGLVTASGHEEFLASRLTVQRVIA